MLKLEAHQLNFSSLLYNKIPKNHILKQINSAISLNFINELLKDSYCSGFGRPAKEPEMMMRILILQKLYNLSDERVIEELSVNLAYMWFIGINPDEETPHASLLSKFRTLRLKDVDLDEVICEIVKQCIDKKIIPDTTGISDDATHIEANTTRKTPERIMKHLARKIFKSIEKENYEIPDYKQIEDTKEAKQIMKAYLETVIEENKENEKAKEAIKEAKEILSSPLFIEQKGIRSLIDKDARVGHKSKTEHFYGYKAEYCMTTDGELITAVDVNNGANVDGENFEALYNKTLKSGIKVKSFYGDKAYFKIKIIKKLEEENIKAYIPVSASAYKVDEELFKYNKDSDQWFCKNGNETIEVKTRNKNGYTQLRYKFEKEKCRTCPYRKECLGKARKIRKILEVSDKAPKYYEYSQFNKTQKFKEEYKKRARIEGKNAEMKRFHGLSRAKGYGLLAVSKQAKLTAIAVNLKKIAKLISLNFIKNKKKITKINIKIYLSNFFDYNLKISATFSVVSVRPHWHKILTTQDEVFHLFITSSPPIYGRNTSGTVILPSSL